MASPEGSQHRFHPARDAPGSLSAQRSGGGAGGGKVKTAGGDINVVNTCFIYA